MFTKLNIQQLELYLVVFHVEITNYFGFFDMR